MVVRQPAISAAQLRPEILIGGFIVFALHFYAYSYFFPYDEGISDAPAWLKAAKDVAYLALAAGLAANVPWRVRFGPQLLFVPLGLALVIASAIHSSHTSLTIQLWENIKNVVIYIPVYMVMFNLTEDQQQRLNKLFFGILAFVAVTQSAFSIFYYASGQRLWLGGLYVGFVGNPNSFALTLNLAAAIALVHLRQSNGMALAFWLALIALLAHTILGTNSGSQFIIFVFLVALAAASGWRYWKRYALAAIAVIAVIAGNQHSFTSTVFTFSNIGQKVLGEGDPSAATEKPTPQEVSQSISLRERDIRRALSGLSKGPATALFGDFKTRRYMPMDGQFWVFLFNSGLLTMLAFALASAWIYLRTLYHVWNNPEDDRMMILHLMIAAFGITFLASRILMYFPFNFMFFMIAGLAMAGLIRRERGS